MVCACVPSRCAHCTRTAMVRVCTGGVRATKGWKRALNAHLGKGVAFATVVDSAATTHTPPNFLEEKRKSLAQRGREGGGNPRTR